MLHDGAVTALVVRRGQAERMAVYVDGRRAFDLSSEVVDRAGLRMDDQLSAARQQELLDEDAPYRARERAVRLLSLRDRSRREIEIRLKQAGFDAAVVASTMDWLDGLGYLDDRRFAAAYAAEKQRSGWGPRRIQAELAARGVDRGIVGDTLAPLGDAPTDGDSTTRVALEQLVRKRFAQQFAADPEGAERRLAGFLSRRGFDWDTIGEMARLLRAEASTGADYPSIP